MLVRREAVKLKMLLGVCPKTHFKMIHKPLNTIHNTAR